MVPWPHPNNPEICKVTLVFSHDTRTFENVFHVKRPGGWDGASLTALGSNVVSWFNSFYKLALPSVVSLVQVALRVYNPLLPLALDIPISPPVPGSVSGAMEASNATSTMSFRTGLAGRAYRGRMYIPGINESSATVDDRISSVLVSLLATAATQLINTALFTGGPLVVFHKPLLIPKPLDNAATAIISYIIENIIDSQRRRLPARGR